MANGHKALSDWEKSAQREAILRGGNRGSTLQDSILNQIEKEIGGERVSTLKRVESRMGQQIEGLVALRARLVGVGVGGVGGVGLGGVDAVSAEDRLEYNKQRKAAYDRRQELIVQREMSGLGIGASESVLREFPLPPSI
eukprot:CAMPEP_0173218156 /NCGR_PEP_ID=MMETSP1142-20121109/900_1 /TAXON_ID=483371 /ORGANISM="non described non described, Strain CCMP2298" /LENGTH=139 /DNA_ID=CAMNT_0014145827 /DNA_START=15 /DNA_END=434 /DNA_ORIENTATION=-